LSPEWQEFVDEVMEEWAEVSDDAEATLDILRAQATDLLSAALTLSAHGAYSFISRELHSEFESRVGTSVVHIDEGWDGGVSYKVGSFNSKGKLRYGPDDGVYTNQPFLLEHLPRGCVFVNNELALFGNRKFFGRQVGDDDDSVQVQRVPEAATHFVRTRKANGELAQVAMHPTSADTWIVGSKNRKVAVASLDEVEQFAGTQAYSFAVEMARAWFRTLEEMGAGRVRTLQRLLRTTRLTLNFEFECPAHQHIVPLHEERLVLIGLSSIYTTAQPLLVAALASYFELECVVPKQYQKLPLSSLDEDAAEIAAEWESEGAVLVLLDDAERVVSLMKVKAQYYICLRAIREKLTRLGADAGPAIRARLGTLRRDGIVQPKFARVFATLGAMFAAQGDLSPGLRDQFPQRYEQFLATAKLPTGPELLDTLDANEADVSLPLLILLQGFPGAGKDHVGRAVAAANPTTVVAFSQDEFDSSSAKCLEAVKHALARNVHVILCRNNANTSQYHRFLQLDVEEGMCRAVFVRPAEVADPSFGYLCAASVLHRKASGADHPTAPMDEVSLVQLVDKFRGFYREAPGSQVIHYLRDEVDETLRPPATFVHAWENKVVSSTASYDFLRAWGLGDPEHNAAVAAGLRDADRTIAELSALIDRLASETAAMPPYGSFVGCQLTPESSAKLRERFGALAEGRKMEVHADHVTLAHSIHYLSDREAWTRAVGAVGEEWTDIRVTGIVDADGVIAVRVDLPDGVPSSLIRSGLPHVTLFTEQGVAARTSIDVLRRESLNPVDDLQLAGSVRLVQRPA
jgi:hypothetical protein